MINEPEQKATLRAYLALLTGSIKYEDDTQVTEYKFTSRKELNVIKKQLKLLGCVAPSDHLRLEHVNWKHILHLVYKGEEVLLFDSDNKCYKVFQLYTKIDENGEYTN